ncbi:MAG: hypothetical protein KDC95_05505 [Planctomycetes bacterium]|nr:hypothetical protein [Planctomycetota bacterium]
MAEFESRDSSEQKPTPRAMTQREKLVSVLGGASALCCFLPWFSVSMSNAAGKLSMPGGFDAGMSWNGFSFAEGILVFVCALVTAAIPVIVSQGFFTIPRRTAAILPLAASALAALCALIYLGRSSQVIGLLSAGRTVWYFLTLIVIGAMAFQSFRYWQAHQVDTAGSPD